MVPVRLQETDGFGRWSLGGCAMADRDGFAFTETLMEIVSVTTLVVMPTLIGVQSSIAASGLSEAREERLVETLRSDLGSLAEHQVLHYLSEEEFATSVGQLSFETTEGVRISVRAAEDGWSATAIHDELGSAAGCAVYFGAMAPPAKPVRPRVPGEVVCTE
jgi:hypothetical protein